MTLSMISIDNYNSSRCRSGYFNLELTNPEGCTKCFCYGQASTCQSASNYFFNPLRSSFTQGLTEMNIFFASIHLFSISGVDGWRAVNQSGHEAPIYSDMGSYIYVQSLPGQDLTFEAPGSYLQKDH